MIFNTSEQKGVVVFIVLIMGFVLYKASGEWNNKTSQVKEVTRKDFKYIKLKEIIDNVSEENHSTKRKSYLKRKQFSKANAQKRKSIVFDFNPNNICLDSLIMLGVNKKTAYNWTKYIEKGGTFKIKNDIKKIYGINNNLFNKLKNSIQLPDSISRNTYFTKSKTKNQLKTNFKKEQKDLIIELNACNAEELKELRGIGDVLSNRIIKFRDKLGGFTSKTQLKEVYGLPIETFDAIKSKLIVNKTSIKKLKINKCDKDTLGSFPYFNYRLASQIINYRNQHGHFKNIEDVRQMKSIDSIKLKKIEPYLDFASN